MNSSTDDDEGPHHAVAPISQPVSGTATPLATANDGDDPGALVGRCAEIAGDGRQRDVGDGGVEHLHEGAQRQRDRGDRELARRAMERAVLLRCDRS